MNRVSDRVSSENHFRLTYLITTLLNVESRLGVKEVDIFHFLSS